MYLFCNLLLVACNLLNMKIKILIILLIVLIFALFSVTNLKNLFNSQNTVEIGGQKIIVELADTGEKRTQGLSGREGLAAGQGMLFVFGQSRVYPFWMKDMRFSIDIIWIQDDSVVDIWPNAPVPNIDDIPSYTPQAEANYVLEVNAGFVERLNIDGGDKVTIDINY